MYSKLPFHCIYILLTLFTTHLIFYHWFVLLDDIVLPFARKYVQGTTCTESATNVLTLDDDHWSELEGAYEEVDNRKVEHSNSMSGKGTKVIGPTPNCATLMKTSTHNDENQGKNLCNYAFHIF